MADKIKFKTIAQSLGDKAIEFNAYEYVPEKQIHVLLKHSGDEVRVTRENPKVELILRNDEAERCITYMLIKSNEIETADQITFDLDENGNLRLKTFDEIMSEEAVAEKLWETFRL